MDNLFSSSGIDQSGSEGALVVGTTAVELKIGPQIRVNRISASLLNNSNTIMYWGYSDAVTTSTGTPIKPSQFVVWGDLSPSTAIFIIAGTPGNDARITEVSG